MGRKARQPLIPSFCATVFPSAGAGQGPVPGGTVPSGDRPCHGGADRVRHGLDLLTSRARRPARHLQRGTASGRRNADGRAFIGSFTAAGGPGVVTAAVDRPTAALTVLSSHRPRSPTPPTSRSAPGGDASTRSARPPTAPWPPSDAAGGTARLLGPPVPVGGSGPTHLSVHDGHVLTANYGSGSVTAVPLRADGTLAPAASRAAAHTAPGPHPQRQQGPHAHQVLPDPSGRWAVSVDLGTDSVRVCRPDATAR